MFGNGKKLLALLVLLLPLLATSCIKDEKAYDSPYDPDSDAGNYMNPAWAVALDNTALMFSTGGGSGGDDGWYATSVYSSYGGTSMRSAYTTTTNDYSWLQTVVTGPGTLAFDWKVSSQSSHDYLYFYIDGAEQSKISGSVNWTTCTYGLGAGPHTLKWEFREDGDGFYNGSNAGWVDHVVWP